MVAFRIDRGGALIVGAVFLVAIGAIPASLMAGLLLGFLTVISLLLHECGHMLAARALGVKVRELGFCLKGAYIRREEARAPLDDFAISISGPLVNALIAAALWTVPGVGHWLAIYNLVLLVSNLAPVPGSDGRRAFYAWTRIYEAAPIQVASPKKK